MKLKKLFARSNLATKEEVIGLFDLCFKTKEKEYFKKYNTPFHFTIAVICGFLAVVIQFYPAVLLESWFGRFIGIGSLSAVIVMSLKGIMKIFLEKTTIIAKTFKKILAKIFKKK